MDPVRLLLISSTAVLSLMLLIEWNQYSDDYHKDQAERYAAEMSKAPSTSPTYNSNNVNTLLSKHVGYSLCYLLRHPLPRALISQVSPI